MTEQEKLKLITDDMYCNKYKLFCGDVPFEVLEYFGGLGFSNYDCELNCRECEHMDEFE